MTAPSRLTVAELLPLIAATERHTSGGAHTPLPACFTCGQPPCEVSTGPGPDYFADESVIQYEHCGHAFYATGDVLAEAALRAREEAP